MSILQYPEPMNPSDLQIWNNAAFDTGDSVDSSPITKPSSWSPLKPIFVNQSQDSLDSCKENQSPVTGKTPVSFKTPATLNPKNLILKPIEEQVRDESKIDQEIEEIQREISLLSSRLEVLRLEKADQKLKKNRAENRAVPAKFMEQKPISKIESSLMGSSRNRIQRRGLSLGPSEISRRGASLGPAEISGAGANFRQVGKPEMRLTPVEQIQNRRKSCFWKLNDIDEERGRSISPKSRKTISRTVLPPRQAVTTIGSKKGMKKEEGVLSSINPRKLFKDGGENSVPAKKPLVKPGRVVASRYNQSSSVIRKRSLPENEKEDSKRFDKKRSSSESSGSLKEWRGGSETRVKKRWEIPSEIAVRSAFSGEESPDLVSELPEFLPRIRNLRCVNESPRDSGPAKRVAELVGRKSFFCVDEEGGDEKGDEPPVCLALSFAED